MIVDLSYDNGKHIYTCELPTLFRRKLKEFLDETFQRLQDNKEVEQAKLLFLGGEWNIPKENQAEFYRELCRLYSRIVQ